MSYFYTTLLRLTLLLAFSSLSAPSVANAAQLPIITLPPQQVCRGTEYIDAEGNKAKGAKVCSAAPCVTSGQTGCLTTTKLRSLNLSELRARDMVKGYQLAGVTGSYDPAAPPPTPCTQMGKINCIATTAFPAVDRKAIVPGNIAKGVSFSGLATGAYPSAQYPLPGFDATDKMLSSQGLTGILASKGSVQFWTVHGDRQVVSIDIGLNPRNIKAGQAIHGIKGTMKFDTFPQCTKDGQVDCVVKNDFLAVDRTKIIPDHLRKGLKIGPITGTYPSKSSALEGASPDVPDLTAGNFHQLLRSNDRFEFFDKRGKRYTYTGDAALRHENISEGVSILGVTGNYKGFSGGDGFNAYDIRTGFKVGDMKGQLDIDCASKGTCNINIWKDESVTADGSYTPCAYSPKKCVFTHRFLKTTWYFPLSRDHVDWNTAKSRCENLRYKGHSDWRLPTQKEAMHAVNVGLSGLPISKHYNNAGHYGAEGFWTSTTMGSGHRRAYYMPARKFVMSTPSSNSSMVNYMCIRQGR